MAAPNAATPAADEGRRERQVAQRLFASEFNAAKHQIKEEGTYGPSFVVTPHGARANRVFGVGVLSRVEEASSPGNFKAQVVDPTGTFYLWAGQYEPEAAAQIQQIAPPSLVAFVGKANLREVDDGAKYLNVRAEQIVRVEKADRDAWVLDTARLTLQRLDAAREATAMTSPTPKMLIDLGFPKEVAEGVIASLGHYGKVDLDAATAAVRDALESLAPGAAERQMAEPSFAPAASAPASAPRPPAASAPMKAVPKAAAPAESPHEPLILSLAEKMDDGKGAPWEDIVAEAAKKGVSEASVEECLNALMDKGLIYEPVLGRLKRT